MVITLKMDSPSSDPNNSIWVNRSADLIHWGGFRCMKEPLPGTWVADKIGGSTPPVKTKEGWLFLFHGVRIFGVSSIYKIGFCLLTILINHGLLRDTHAIRFLLLINCMRGWGMCRMLCLQTVGL